MGHVNCKICEQLICRYEMDIGDTIGIEFPDSEGRDGGEMRWICDDCAKKIAHQLIDR